MERRGDMPQRGEWDRSASLATLADVGSAAVAEPARHRLPEADVDSAEPRAGAPGRGTEPSRAAPPDSEAYWRALSDSALTSAGQAVRARHMPTTHSEDVSQNAMALYLQRCRKPGENALELPRARGWVHETTTRIAANAQRSERRRRLARALDPRGPSAPARDFSRLAQEMPLGGLPLDLVAAVRLLAAFQDFRELERVTGIPRAMISGRAKLAGWALHSPNSRGAPREGSVRLQVMRQAGLTREEMATVSGLTTHAVKRRLDRAQQNSRNLSPLRSAQDTSLCRVCKP